MLRWLTSHHCVRLLQLLAATFLAVILAAGCSRGPRAPALQDGPVYQNTKEGFRFLVPEGWTQYVSGDVPPGRIEQEQLLVEYKLLTADQPAAFQVALVDLAPTMDLGAYLRSNPFGGETWQMDAPTEQREVGGVTATHAELRNKAGKDATVREVVAFRRGERVYFFTGVFAATDANAREQVRRAVASIVWKN
jgi:hypothetical protein